MKTKALASYDQLILATKRRSYCGPVSRVMLAPATIRFFLSLFGRGKSHV